MNPGTADVAQRGGRAARELLQGIHRRLLQALPVGGEAVQELLVQPQIAEGIREIGRRRQARIVGDRRYDVVLMDILAEE